MPPRPLSGIAGEGWESGFVMSEYPLPTLRRFAGEGAWRRRSCHLPVRPIALE